MIVFLNSSQLPMDWLKRKSPPETMVFAMKYGGFLGGKQHLKPIHGQLWSQGPWSSAGPHQLQPGHGQSGSQQLAPSAAAAGDALPGLPRHRLQLRGKPRVMLTTPRLEKLIRRLRYLIRSYKMYRKGVLFGCIDREGLEYVGCDKRFRMDRSPQSRVKVIAILVVCFHTVGRSSLGGRGFCGSNPCISAGFLVTMLFGDVV